jgi:hypothetical protein
VSEQKEILSSLKAELQQIVDVGKKEDYHKKNSFRIILNLMTKITK